MTLEFPNPPVAVDPVVTEIRLPGHDAKTGEDVECRITAKALMEHCGAKEPTDKELLRALDAHRERIEGAAKRKFADSEMKFEPDRIIITLDAGDL